MTTYVRISMSIPSKVAKRYKTAKAQNNLTYEELCELALKALAAQRAKTAEKEAIYSKNMEYHRNR
uniref:Uncharacterized protein n=1 Tax=uncultured microorganism TaxID=358574 RepID=A0A1L3KS63_9ZZZZ|nr:hypothetical protein [uncultured microorganism]